MRHAASWDMISMNRFDRSFPLKGEAKLRYRDGEYDVVTPGNFVRCAITGNPIALEELRYWSVERQEAYSSAELSMQRYTEAGGPGA